MDDNQLCKVLLENLPTGVAVSARIRAGELFFFNKFAPHSLIGPVVQWIE
jgi:hypothetical protein